MRIYGNFQFAFLLQVRKHHHCVLRLEILFVPFLFHYPCSHPGTTFNLKSPVLLQLRAIVISLFLCLSCSVVSVSSWNFHCPTQSLVHSRCSIKAYRICCLGPRFYLGPYFQLAAWTWTSFLIWTERSDLMTAQGASTLLVLWQSALQPWVPAAPGIGEEAEEREVRGRRRLGSRAATVASLPWQTSPWTFLLFSSLCLSPRGTSFLDLPNHSYMGLLSSSSLLPTSSQLTSAQSSR